MFYVVWFSQSIFKKSVSAIKKTLCSPISFQYLVVCNHPGSWEIKYRQQKDHTAASGMGREATSATLNPLACRSTRVEVI